MFSMSSWTTAEIGWSLFTGHRWFHGHHHGLSAYYPKYRWPRLLLAPLVHEVNHVISLKELLSMRGCFIFVVGDGQNKDHLCCHDAYITFLVFSLLLKTHHHWNLSSHYNMQNLYSLDIFPKHYNNKLNYLGLSTPKWQGNSLQSASS